LFCWLTSTDIITSDLCGIIFDQNRNKKNILNFQTVLDDLLLFNVEIGKSGIFHCVTYML
jgi:hypothetical protein